MQQNYNIISMLSDMQWWSMRDMKVKIFNNMRRIIHYNPIFFYWQRIEKTSHV